jgi:yecA family protein
MHRSLIIIPRARIRAVSSIPFCWAPQRKALKARGGRLTTCTEKSPMPPRRHTARAPRAQEPALLLPPDLSKLGPLPFAPPDRAMLKAWLSDCGWPRDRMDIAMLEGYLVALLVWPVGVPPGAWLPPVWGERGWKVPAKIATSDAYAKFTRLVVGFLQELDRALDARPSHFAPTLSWNEPAHAAQRAPGVSWAQGFLRALQQSQEGLAGRSTAARSAVSRIAGYASFTVSSPAEAALAVEDLSSAVLILAAERTARGPLGALHRKDAVAH